MLALVIALLVAIPAHADNSLDDAVAALKDAPVYVAPGTEGTSPTTASDLMDLLRDGDNIAIVMLPASAGDPGSAAGKIDQATGHKRIVAVSVDNNLAASSGIMPSGKAADLLARAVNVSTNPVETLQTFIRNVHSWQAQHPQAPASKPTQKDKGGPPLVPIILVVVLATVLGFFAARQLLQPRSYDTAEGPIRFQSSPDKVRDILRDIMERRAEVNDGELGSIIEQACQDTEQYFRRNSDPSKRDEDTTTFVNHLKGVRNVLVQYLDIQNNRRYYDDPEGLMQQGYDAIDGFAAFVLQSNKRGRRDELTEFRVDTQILSAQRYS
jgi:hypothetical protein